ncbi:MAG: hypothetical protein ACSHXD_11120 [Marinosulfonomonas sp.]
MTNRIAIALAVILIGLLFADYELRDGQTTLFWARKFVNLIDWVKFWR